MTAFSAAPPLGTGTPTDGATSTVWTGSSNFDKTLQTLINLRLEEQLRNPLPYLLPGNFMPAQFVKGSNGTMRFLAVGDLPVDVSDTSDIWVKVEGEPNGTEDLDLGYEEFGVKQAMFTLRLTDVATDFSPLQLIPIAAEKTARRILEISNAIAAKAILAGSNAIYAGGAANRAALDSGSIVTSADVRRAVAYLEITNVPKFADGYYRGFLNPFVKYDFESDGTAGGWIDAHRYASPSELLTGEIGRYAGVRFLQANAGSLIAGGGSGSDDIYSTAIIGPGAFAFGDFGGGHQYFTPPGGHSDPGHQSALLTWIGYLGAMVVGEGTSQTGPVSEPRYVRIESGASLGDAALGDYPS